MKTYIRYVFTYLASFTKVQHPSSPEHYMETIKLLVYIIMD